MSSNIPLAERMRPQTIDDIVGQEHIVGEGSVLRNALNAGRIHSIIFWGPPGVGKTTLATVISHHLNLPFYQLSAISSGVKEIREVIDVAKKQQGAILFIDEIHRFNKSQQDALLGAVEKGIITLIGATTENPSFEVNSALLSRSQVYVLKPLDATQLVQLLHTAMQKDEVLKALPIELAETEALIRLSGGDARRLLNLFEISIQALQAAGAKSLRVTDDIVMKAAQSKVALYDKKGEQHYDIISAFIKSMRGSDPNGAIYWMARMIVGGEEYEFIARRMVIFASEDIGNANPTAIVMANACFEAVRKIGKPEGRIILGQCCTYLASSPKSNASYMAIDNALALVEKYGDLPVPLHIRNAPTKLMKEMGYGKGYQYAHDYDQGYAGQDCLPEKLAGRTFYEPKGHGYEKNIRERMEWLKKRKTSGDKEPT
jgi:putative ATPase